MLSMSWSEEQHLQQQKLLLWLKVIQYICPLFILRGRKVLATCLACHTHFIHFISLKAVNPPAKKQQ